MNKLFTIAAVATGLLFATAMPSEARDRHHRHHHNHGHRSHYHAGHHHHGGHYRSHRHHRHYYGGYRQPYYYGSRPVYRAPRYYDDYYYPRRGFSIFVPGIGHVIRNY